MHSDQPAARAWRGTYTDGRSAAARPVTVTLERDAIAIRDGAGLDLSWSYVQLSTGAPLVETARDALLFPGERSGTSLFVADNAFVGELITRAPQTSRSAFRRAGLRAAGPVGIAAALMAGVVTVFDLSPSKAVARLIPDHTRASLGENVLATLPNQKVCDAPEGRAALDALVVRLRPDLAGKPHKVRVLDWGLINAFAVPGGTVVLTRAIINKAANADEIAGVLAHEMGHGMELHPEAGLVRGVGFWALVQMMFTGTPGPAGTVGSTLAQLAYSRGYEREADAIALRLLREAEIANKPFAGFFRRMEGERGGRTEPSKGLRVTDILQTHPSSPERIAKIEGQPPYPNRPALTEAQWQALRRICGATTALDTAGSDIKPKTLPPDSGLKDADARIARNPREAGSYGDRGAIHLRERRFADAVADFSRAIEREPNSAFYRFERGRAHQNAGSFDLARTDYGEAIRLNPNYSNAFAARGATLRLQTRMREARADLDEAIRINPRNDYALYQRGLINATETRWAESESDFARVVAAQRSYALAHVRRAEALEQLKRRDDAINAYREALAASPSSPDASIAFGIARDRLAALGAP